MELSQHDHRQPTPSFGPHADRRPTLGTLLALLGITAGALLLRLHNLGQWGVWIDELYTVQHAAELASGWINARSLAYLPSLIGFELAGVDMASVEPLEIRTWRSSGVTEWNIRAPVALLGAITILVLGLMSRRILGTGPTLWLSLLLALSPWHLWMSQVGRFYMQLFLLYNLALLLYYEVTKEGSLWRAAAAAGCIVLAFYTTPIALAIVVVFGIDIAVSLLRRRPTGMRPALWAMGVAGIAACLASIPFQFTHEYSSFVGSQQSIPMVIVGMAYLVGVPMTLVAALGFWALVRKTERLAILLAAAAVVPPVAFIVLNLLGKDTHVRYTFMALFAWLALAAVGIELIAAALRTRWPFPIAWLPAVALLSTFALADYIYMTGGAGYQTPWRPAMAYIEAHRRPGEPVLGDHGVFRIAEYYLEDPDVVMLPRGFSLERDLPDLVSGPAWILLHHGFRGAQRFQKSQTGGIDPATGRPRRSAAGKLQAYFTNRIAQPYRAVNVYYYTPPAPAAQAAHGARARPR